jgi:hypothetical protein
MSAPKSSTQLGNKLPIQPNLSRWRWDSIKLEIAACVEPLLVHSDFELSDAEGMELNIEEFLNILESGGRFRLVFYNDLHRNEIESLQTRIAKCDKTESVQELVDEFDALLTDIETNVLRQQESVHYWTRHQSVLFSSVNRVQRVFLRDKGMSPILRIGVLKCAVDCLVRERLLLSNDLIEQQRWIRENLLKLNADGICQIEAFQMFRRHHGYRCKIFKPTFA